MDHYTEHVLYDKVQSIRMPDGKSRDLRITVSEKGRPYKKVILKVTDDDDPSVLYSLHVTELDFTSLKAQQGLLVEFSNFAVHLVRLLEQCVNNTKGFLVIIEDGPSNSCLKVVQPIDLKNLCYISLHITTGSETEILNHMKAQIMTLKADKESTRNECNILQQQVLQLKNELHEKDCEMRRKEQKYLEDHDHIQQKAAAEISRLRDHLLLEKRTELDLIERKKENLTVQFQELNAELKNLKEKHRKLGEKYDESQRSVRELNNCIATMEGNHTQMRSEIADLRRDNTELEGLCRKKDQELHQCRSQIESMEKELNKLHHRLSHQDKQLHASDEEQVKLRSTVAHLQETNKARNDLLRQVNSDLTKANLIIKERQKELEAANKELHQFAVDNQEKARQITKQSLELNLLRAAVEKSEEKVKSLSIKEKELSVEVASLRKSLAAKEDEHARCGDVISYLHRSLKKVQMESSVSPSPILHTGPVIPPPTFASINPTALSSKGPSYSTPLGASDALPPRRSFPGTAKEQISEKGASKTRKSEERFPKTTLKQNQLGTQRSNGTQKRTESAGSKEKPANEASSEKTTSTLKAKDKGQADAKDAVEKKQNKENKKVPFKASSYFQPNRIITDF